MDECLVVAPCSGMSARRTSRSPKGRSAVSHALSVKVLVSLMNGVSVVNAMIVANGAIREIAVNGMSKVSATIGMTEGSVLRETIAMIVVVMRIVMMADVVGSVVGIAVAVIGMTAIATPATMEIVVTTATMGTVGMIAAMIAATTVRDVVERTVKCGIVRWCWKARRWKWMAC